MTTVRRFDKWAQRAVPITLLILALLLTLFVAGSLAGQTQPRPAPPDQAQKPQPPAQGETKITPEQAEELFRSVDDILKFVSKDTHLPIQHPVKRALVGREQVREFVLKHMREDRDAQRLQRSEASMKKFGLLPQEFDLRKFLVDLLEDQVAGYYDEKTKTVNLLNWVTPEAQRPVLAHELTHALQDQNFNLETWLKVVPDDHRDNPDNLDAGPDEEQAARQAVSEGQGMGVMMDYVLAPTGHSLADTPALADALRQNTMDNVKDSPTFAAAPMYLREMVVFPYTYGLSFLEDLLARGGPERAFAGAFKDPPHDTREIMQPKSYLAGQHVEPLRLPKLSEVLRKNYIGYDSGSVGEFDVYVLLKQFSGADLAERLSTAWRGGVYYLGRKKSAPAPKADAPAPMGDLGLLYVSNWATPEDAGYFARVYSLWLPKKYKSVKPVADQKGRAWETDQGPVSIDTTENRVLVTESIDPATAAAIREKVLAEPQPKPAWIPPQSHNLAAPVWATLGILH